MDNRPYIICHMVTSIDGKVTGEFLSREECAEAVDIYYRINRELESDGFICGRVTMEGSFTGGWYPDLSHFEPIGKEDYTPDTEGKRYAVAFDTHGRLGWKAKTIIDPDGDPGYDGARIIEVLSEDVDGRYLAYLRETGIPYIFAGERDIDIKCALYKLHALFGCRTLLLEGGSIINGAFLRAGAVDELCLVVSPAIADRDDKPLFYDCGGGSFELLSAVKEGTSVIMRYRKRTD